jgi:hypothetical protein
VHGAASDLLHISAPFCLPPCTFADCHHAHTRCKTGHHVDDDEQEDGTMAETHFPHDGPTTTVVVTPVAAAASDDDGDGDE